MCAASAQVTLFELREGGVLPCCTLPLMDTDNDTRVVGSIVHIVFAAFFVCPALFPRNSVRKTPGSNLTR